MPHTRAMDKHMETLGQVADDLGEQILTSLRQTRQFWQDAQTDVAADSAYAAIAKSQFEQWCRIHDKFEKAYDGE